VVAANALPGLAFGWLYWRQGLEAAILAHALAHVFAWVGGRFV
jgi:membrane protease YdiL (CAAX protease family)